MYHSSLNECLLTNKTPEKAI